MLRGDGGDCEPHPWGSPLRALRYGADLRSSKFVPDEFVEPVGSSTTPSPPDTQNAPNGAFCVSGGEGVR